METMKQSVLQFEYKIMTYYGLMEIAVTHDFLKKELTSSEDVLNELGKDGWELLTILREKENSLFIFKRSKWLEKQDTTAQLSEENQNRFAKCVLSSCALSFINYLDAHKYKGKMCVSNGECEDIENAFQNAIWDKLHRYYCKYIENQNEQPRYNIGDVLCDKSCTTLDKNAQPNFKIVDIRNDMYICDKCSFPICQQDEYELVSKYEQKFKIGEWILNNVCLPIKISSIEDDMYRFDDGSALSISFIDENYHLWTIEDAKDGDVLVYKDEISIYKHDIKNCTKQETTFGGFVYHCCYDGKRFITDSLYSLTEQDKMDIHPANKEQRDALFAKMKEDGYEWDTEEKELKKIEQKSAWSEEDKAVLDALIRMLEGEEIYVSPHLAVECLKSLKNRVILQPKEWSEDGWTMQDEEELQIVLDTLVKTGQHSSAKWLKNVCFIPQKQWKPSEEQIKAFEHFVRSIGESGYTSPYENNTKLLYSLLGQLKKLTEQSYERIF